MRKLLFSAFALVLTATAFAQPANDDCVTATAITIPGSGNICGTYNNNTAFSDLTTNACDVGLPGNEIWFTYITTGSANTITATPSGGAPASNMVVTVTDQPCAAGVYTTCASAAGAATATVNWTYPVGTQVWVTVETNGTDGQFDLCITSTTPPPAPGNSCATASIICDKAPFTVASFPTNSSAFSPSCWFPAGTPLQGPIFYQFTVGTTGTCEWQADPLGAVEFDWAMYDITSGCPGTLVSCNYHYALDVGAPVGLSTAACAACPLSNIGGAVCQEFCAPINVTAGNTYLIILDNYSHNTVGFNWTWGGTFVMAPTASFTVAPATGCGSLTTTITNNSVAVTTYDWDFGDGTANSSSSNPGTHNYSSPGTYLLNLTATSASGCVDIQSQTIQVGTPSVATFSYPATPYCANGADPSPQFSGGGVAGTFTSTAGLSINASTGVVDLSASTPGTYTVTNTIAATALCPLVTATATITITALPVATFSYTGTPYCQNAANPSPTFSGGGVAGTFTSTAGLSINASTGAVNLGASTPGTYTVTNTIATAGGCPQVQATSTITINAVQSSAFSYTGSPFCQNGSNATPTITGTAGGTFTAAPAGLTINASTGVITVSTSTVNTYTVTYTTPGPCPTSTNVSVAIVAAPVATFSYTGSPYCQNAANPSPTFSGGGVAGTFTSTAGLSINSSTGVVNLGASTPGTYTVTNTIAASGTCAQVQATASITITAVQSSAFSYTGSPFCQNGSNATPTITGVAGGTFTAAPAGLSINASTGVITVSSSTVNTYTVTYTTAGPCPSSTNVSVTITAPAVATFSYTGSPYCQNAANPSPTFSGGGVAGTFTSTAGLSINASTGVVNLGASTPGTYTVTNTIAASGSCAQVQATATITINAVQSSAFSYTGSTFCTSGTNPSPTITGVGGGTFTATPAGLSINASTGAINLGASSVNTYTVTYTTPGPCPSSSTASVTVTTAPSASFSYANASYCQNGSDPSPVFGGGASAGTFTAAPAGLSINSSTGVIDLSASTPGNYTVTNSIPLSGGCPATSATTNITITAPSVGTFSYTGSPYCSSDTDPSPTFSGGGIAGTFTSTAGLVINATTGQIDLSASTPGTYTVTNTIAASGGCTQVIETGSITITSAPVADAGPAGYLCNGQSLTLSGTGSGTPSWLPTTGLTGAGTLTPTANPTSTTMYYLTLTSGGCTSTDSVLVTVTTPSPLVISNDTTICIGDCANLSVSGADYYSWSPSAGMTDSTATTQTVCPSGTQTYTVTGYTISVNSVANGDFESGNTAFTSDYTFQPPPNGGEGEFWVATGPQVSTWNGGMSSSGDHTSGAGNLLIVNGAGTPGNNVWCQTIIVQPNTDYVFSAWVSSFNVGTQALLQFSINGVNLSTPFAAPASINTWSEFYAAWNSGASTSATICIVNQNTSLGGNDFGLDDIFFSAVCQTTEDVTVTVQTLTDATITAAGPFCADAAATQLTAATAGGTWSGTGVNSSGLFTPSLANIGTNTIVYTIPGSCGDVDSVDIVVNALPTANAGTDDTLGCVPNTLNLNGNGSSAGATYAWTTSNGNIVSGAATTTPTIDAPGTYTLTVTLNGCTSTDNVVVVNSPAPNAAFTATPTTGFVPLNVTTNNTSTGTGLTYLWNFGDGNTSGVFEPTYIYDTLGTFDLSLIVIDAYGCVDTASVTMVIYDEFEVIIPNVFTPNGDGTNDVFELITQGVTDIDASIYDRWGVFMSSFKGITGNWDGKREGKEVPEGVYFYILLLTKADGTIVEYNGHVTLLRTK